MGALVDPKSNGHYETTDLKTAAIVHAAGLRYIQTEWKPAEGQAVFVFDKLSDSLRESLQTFSVAVNGFALFNSWNFLRDELEAAKRRRVR